MDIWLVCQVEACSLQKWLRNRRRLQDVGLSSRDGIGGLDDREWRGVGLSNALKSIPA